MISASDKESDYIEALRNQVRALEYSLEQRDDQLHKESERTLELKLAFKENYALLQRRTDELESAEQNTLSAKNALRECQERMAILNTQLEETSNKLREEKFSKESQRQTFQDLLERRAQEVELLTHARDLAASRAVEEAAAERRRLEADLLRSQDELAVQRRELLAEQEQRLREATVESNKRIDVVQQEATRQRLLAEHLQAELQLLETQRAEYLSKDEERVQQHRIEEELMRSTVFAAQKEADIARQAAKSAQDQLETALREAAQAAADAALQQQALRDELGANAATLERSRINQEAERERLRKEVAGLVDQLEKAQSAAREREAAADASAREARAAAELVVEELRDARSQLEAAQSQRHLSSVVNEQELQRLREENLRLREDVQFYK